MADPAVKRAANGMTDQSIGDLVSVAARDVSQLVRYELDLAKLELKSDAKRLGFSAGVGVVALFAACLVLMLLCFAFAFGLNAIGAPGGLWGAFLWVALTCAVLIIIAGFIAWRLARHLTGMRKTRRSLAEGASLLRRSKPGSTAKASAKAG
jgi:uncharacterized membrane protein YqjE